MGQEEKAASVAISTFLCSPGSLDVSSHNAPAICNIDSYCRSRRMYNGSRMNSLSIHFRRKRRLPLERLRKHFVKCLFPLFRKSSFPHRRKRTFFPLYFILPQGAFGFLLVSLAYFIVAWWQRMLAFLLLTSFFNHMPPHLKQQNQEYFYNGSFPWDLIQVWKLGGYMGA